MAKDYGTAVITIPSTGEKKVITLVACGACGFPMAVGQEETHEKYSWVHPR